MRAQLEVGSILQVLFRHQRKILTVMAVCTLGAGIIDVTMTPRYEAHVNLLVKNTRSVSTSTERSIGTAGDNNAAVSSELLQMVASSYNEILKSDDVASHVIQAVGLAKIYPNIAANPPRSGTALGAAIRQFSKDNSVELVKSTNLLAISFKHPDPAVARRVVATMVDVFLNKQARDLANPETAFMSRRVDSASKTLESAQNKLLAFQQSTHINEADKELATLNDARYDLLAKQRDQNLQLALLNGQISTLQHQLGHSVPQYTEIYSDNDLRYRSLDDVNSKLVDLRQQEEKLLRNYQKTADPVVRLRAQIKVLEQSQTQLQAMRTRRQGANPVYQDLSKQYYQAKAQAEGARDGLKELATQQRAVETRMAQLFKDKNAFNDLQRNSQLADSAYRKAMEDFQHSQNAEAMNTHGITDVAPIGDPQVSDKPVSPAKVLNLIFGLVGGLIFGIAVALFSEMMEDMLTSSAQVEDMVGIPVLASFPISPEEEAREKAQRPRKWYWPF